MLEMQTRVCKKLRSLPFLILITANSLIEEPVATVEIARKSILPMAFVA